jgi:multidrug efflux pump subunit AcrA (membrane-fusion protein)
LDEVDLQKVRVGQKVLFEFSSFGLEFEGKVEKISKVANSESGIVVIPTEFSFIVDPRSKGIITGLTCDVKIVLMEKADALFIPINAVKRDQKGTYVLVKGEKEGETVPVYIKTGASSSNTIEVTEGLQEGQKIVITPSAAVLNTFSTQGQQGGLDLGMMGGGGGAPPMQGGGGPGW